MPILKNRKLNGLSKSDDDSDSSDCSNYSDYVSKHVDQQETSNQLIKSIQSNESDYSDHSDHSDHHSNHSDYSNYSDESHHSSKSNNLITNLDNLTKNPVIANDCEIIQESINKYSTGNTMNENNNYLRHFLFDRMANNYDDFNILLTGKVSSGKTMLLNALLGDCYSESKIQKTTKGISLYITECDNADNREFIFKQNKSMEFDMHNKRVPFKIFEVGKVNILNKLNDLNDSNDSNDPNDVDNLNKLYDSNNLNKKTINIFDTIGIDDPDVTVDKMTQKWIKKNADFVDVFVIVMDIKSALLTKSDATKLEQTINICNGNIIFAINKYDDSDNEELNELYIKIVNQITKIMERVNRKKFSFCHISALHEYILNLKKLNKIDRLTLSEQNLSKIISTSSFENFYSNINNFMKFHTQKIKILNFLKSNIVTNKELLLKFFKILNNYAEFVFEMLHQENIYEIPEKEFTEEEKKDIINYIYKSINNYIQDSDELSNYNMINISYPNLDEYFDIVINLKKLKINDYFFKDENYLKNKNFLNDIKVIIDSTNDPTEKNIILELICKKETESIILLFESNKTKKLAKNHKSHYTTNTNHYNHITTYSKLICTDGDKSMLLNALNSFIELLIVSNVLCDTVSAQFEEKENNKLIYKTILHFLLTTTKSYNDIFSTHRQLNKLKYIDCNIGSQIGKIPEEIYLSLNLDNLQNHFAYLNEIKRVSQYIY